MTVLTLINLKYPNLDCTRLDYKYKFGNLCLVDYFSVVTMIIGIVFYIVGKPVYLP